MNPRRHGLLGARQSCSAIPELGDEDEEEGWDDEKRAISWHHPQRPYQVLRPFPTIHERGASFRSISHDSIVGPRPLPRHLNKDELLQDWVLAVTKIGRNPLWTSRHPDLQTTRSVDGAGLSQASIDAKSRTITSSTPAPSSLMDRVLSPCQVLSYAVGHMVNDLGGACWFTYGVYFLQNVAITGEDVEIKAGQVMLAGQVADAVATVFCGVLADKWRLVCCDGRRMRFGPKKAWHFFGSLLVMLGFLGLFGVDPFAPSTTASFAYLVSAASLFNVGWAAVQVSHLALIPELTPYDNERCQLVSVRYTFTVLSNLIIFLLYLATGEDSRNKYLFITLTVTAIATVSNILFWGGTTEPPRKDVSEHGDMQAIVTEKDKLVAQMGKVEEEDEMGMRSLTTPLLEDGTKLAQPSVLRWLLRKDFYFVGVVYMLTRIVVNLSQVYLTLYIQNSLYQGRPASESERDRALVPLTLYLSSFLATFRLEAVNRYLGRKITYGLGAVLVMVAALIFYLIGPDTAGLVYLGAVILGLGNTIIMVTSVSMEGDLVGHDTDSSSFVYGTLSFTDKLSNGLLILLVAGMQQSACPAYDPEGLSTNQCSLLFRNVMGLSSAAPALLGAIVALFVSTSKSV